MLFEIQQEIEEKCKRKILLCALQGSQNYNLSDEKSDVDVKIFIMPNFEDLYHGKKISETYETKYGKAEVKDIRLLPDLIKKMNPSYLEVLVTKHFVADEEFFFIYKKMQEYLQEIIDSRLTLLLRAILGSIRSKAKNLEQSDGSYKTKEFGYILRLYELFKKIAIKHINFKEALYNTGDKREYLLKAKREVLFGVEIAKQEAENICNKIETFIDTKCSNKCDYENKIIEEIIQKPIMEFVYDDFRNSF